MDVSAFWLQDPAADGADLVGGFRGFRAGAVDCLFCFMTADSASDPVPVAVMLPTAEAVGFRDGVAAIGAGALVLCVTD